MEEDLHMALCVVKVLALVVIAASLWSLSGSGSSGFGYATDGYMPPFDPSANAPGSASDLTAHGSTEGSQVGRFGNRYEAPVFWNIGDINKYETNQNDMVVHPNKYDGAADAASMDAVIKNMSDARKNSGTFRGPRGYFGKGAPRGYMGIPGIPTASGTISPY